MVGSNRAELQSAIAKNDVESLCEVTNKVSFALGFMVSPVLESIDLDLV